MASVLLMRAMKAAARTRHTDYRVQTPASLTCLSSPSTASPLCSFEFPHVLRPVFTLLWSLLGVLQCPECFVSLQSKFPF